MENFMGSAEFLTVFAVSGGIALISVRAHQRLLSDFMDKISFQFDGRSWRFEGTKKIRKVHFAEDVAEPSSDNKDYRRRKRAFLGKPHGESGDDQMPMNRQRDSKI